MCNQRSENQICYLPREYILDNGYMMYIIGLTATWKEFFFSSYFLFEHSHDILSSIFL